MSNAHEFTATTVDGATQALAAYAGKVLLVVNVASQCGLTPQYAGLQALHDRLAARGFAVLGFPCNQFGSQEPGSEGQIKTFCETKYGVTFPMFAKVDVNGPGSHPLFAWLTAAPTQPDGAGDVQWNFAKFLIDKQGKVVARFAPTTKPDDPALVAAIEAAL
jgi:glutathione peroxidase